MRLSWNFNIKSLLQWRYLSLYSYPRKETYVLNCMPYKLKSHSRLGYCACKVERRCISSLSISDVSKRYLYAITIFFFNINAPASKFRYRDYSILGRDCQRKTYPLSQKIRDIRRGSGGTGFMSGTGFTGRIVKGIAENHTQNRGKK